MGKKSLESKKGVFVKPVEALKDILGLSLEDIESLKYCPCCKRD